MTTAAERFAHIGQYQLECKPGTVTFVPISEHQDIAAWIGHLHTADPATLDHMAAAAEAMPRSPAIVRMRDAVEFERARRVVTAGIEASRG